MGSTVYKYYWSINSFKENSYVRSVDVNVNELDAVIKSMEGVIKKLNHTQIYNTLSNLLDISIEFSLSYSMWHRLREIAGIDTKVFTNIMAMDVIVYNDQLEAFVIDLSDVFKAIVEFPMPSHMRYNYVFDKASFDCWNVLHNFVIPSLYTYTEEKHDFNLEYARRLLYDEIPYNSKSIDPTNPFTQLINKLNRI